VRDVAWVALGCLAWILGVLLFVVDSGIAYLVFQAANHSNGFAVGAWGGLFLLLVAAGSILLAALASAIIEILE